MRICIQNKLLPQQSFVARDERCRSADISLFFDDIDRFGRLPPFHIPRSVLLKNPHLASDKFPVAPDGKLRSQVCTLCIIHIYRGVGTFMQVRGRKILEGTYNDMLDTCLIFDPYKLKVE